MVLKGQETFSLWFSRVMKQLLRLGQQVPKTPTRRREAFILFHAFVKNPTTMAALDLRHSMLLLTAHLCCLGEGTTLASEEEGAGDLETAPGMLKTADLRTQKRFIPQAAGRPRAVTSLVQFGDYSGTSIKSGPPAPAPTIQTLSLKSYLASRGTATNRHQPSLGYGELLKSKTVKHKKILPCPVTLTKEKQE